jgi:2-polyprenyl-3-methyl-5-hydroxy-6-metoxy-1,4-benzoquinol methylase
VKIHRDELDATLVGDPYKYAKHTGRDDLERHFQSFALSITGEDGLVSSRFLVERDCPLCRGHESTPQFIKYGFTIVKCNGCDFDYVNPILRQDLFPSSELEIGALSDRHLEFLSGDTYLASAALRFEYELQQILGKIGRPASNLLEIGCSIGVGLEIAEQYNLLAEGVEPNSATAKISTSNGYTVHNELFSSSLYPNTRFDIVMSMDVLEHVPDPIDFLSQIRDVLTDGGITMVQVPNAGALICKLEGEENQIFNGLIHLNYFTPKSLNDVAMKAGLTNISTETILSELGKIRQHDDHKIWRALGGTPKPTSDYKIDQNWILDNGLGYKILGFYSKK